MSEALDLLHLLNSGNEINNLLPGNFDSSQFRVYSLMHSPSQSAECICCSVVLCHNWHSYSVALILHNCVSGTVCMLSTLQQRCDFDHVVAMGHSFGGATALVSLALDKRFQ